MKDRIAKDIVTAMKEKDKVTLETLRMVKGAIQMEEIKAKKELTNDDIALVIGKQIKTRKESIVEFERGNRQDLIDKTNSEIEILSAYMPEQISEEELSNIIEQAIKEVNATTIKDMGSVMKIVSSKVKGRADMQQVSSIIKSKLN